MPWAADQNSRLSRRSLRYLPDGVARPAYDRTRLARGIVHVGLGAFHRAHQALYTEAVVAQGDLRWGIVGVSLRDPSVSEAASRSSSVAIGLLSVRWPSDVCDYFAL